MTVKDYNGKRLIRDEHITLIMYPNTLTDIIVEHRSIWREIKYMI